MKKRILTAILGLSIIVSVGYSSDYFEVAKQIEIYTTLFKELNMHYIDEVNPAQLTNNAITNMLKNLDPYTRYYDEQGVEDAKIRRNGEYAGIGATMNTHDKEIVIREVYQNSPAAKAGLQAGDHIIQIDDIIVKDYEGSNVTSFIKGAVKTKVNLKVKRQNKTLNIEITRDKIIVNPVPFYHMIDDEVGYIAFIKFNAKASTEVKKAFLDLKSQGMKKLVIDIRHNGGGLLNQVIDIVNFFIPKGKIVVTTKAKTKQWSSTYKTKKEPLDTEIPIAILIDNRSASASEILAGALQDYDRAVIVGQRSFGKGLVQRTRKLTYGTMLKLTISKYYTPSGRCIQELDYTNRDKKGNIPKFSDGKRNTFKTTNGRLVYDGGGVLPDVTLHLPKKTKATSALLRSNVLFNYVTDYFYKHENIVKAADFKLKDSDYQDLKRYIKTTKASYDLLTNKYLKKVQENVKKEGLESKISNELEALKTAIETEKLKELDVNKEEILSTLTSEIVRRYYFKEGEYIQKIHANKTLQKAVAVLKDASKYTKILK